MTYQCSSLIACPQIQADLNSVFGFNPQLMTEDSRLLKLLLSPQNKNNIFQNQLDQGDAHRRQVQLVYQPRLVTGSSSATVGNTCVGGNTPCNLSKTYEIDETQGSAIQFSLDLTTIQEKCEKDDTFLAKWIAQHMDLLVRDINARSATEVATLSGVNPDSGVDTPTNCATLASAACCSGKVTNLLEVVDWVFKEMEWDGNVFAVGGSFLWTSYWKSLSLACCNDLGENLNAMMRASQIVPFYDRNMRTALTAANNFMAWIPGALQLITYNQHRGARGIVTVDDETHKRGVLAHPNPEIPLLFDYYAELSCNKWNFYLGLAHEVVGAPDDAFFATDRLSGVTGVHEFAIVNP
jgi:hypothetical protein